LILKTDCSETERKYTHTTIIHTYIQNKTGSSENHRQTQLTLSYKT